MTSRIISMDESAGSGGTEIRSEKENPKQISEPLSNFFGPKEVRKDNFLFGWMERANRACLFIYLLAILSRIVFDRSREREREKRKTNFLLLPSLIESFRPTIWSKFSVREFPPNNFAHQTMCEHLRSRISVEARTRMRPSARRVRLGWKEKSERSDNYACA